MPAESITRLTLKALGLLGLCTCFLSCNSDRTPDPGDRIFFRHPAGIWEETLPLGNGRLGMMPDGGIEEEQIILNEISLWSGSESDYSNPQAAESLDGIRRLLLEGKNGEAQELMYRSFVPKKDVADPRYGSYEVLGLLTLKQDFGLEAGQDSVSGYIRSLDLEHGIASTDFFCNGNRYRREYFTSRDRDCDVIYLEARDGGGVNCSLNLSRDHTVRSRVEDGCLILEGQLESGNPTVEGMKYRIAAKALASGGNVRVSADSGLLISGAEQARILLSATTSFQAAGTDFPGEDYAHRCDSLLKSALEVDYAVLKDRHMRAHAALYNRIDLKLPQSVDDTLPTDERLQRFQQTQSPSMAELYYNFGRYLLISGTREGSLPPNLQGLWANTLQTPWNGDYHTNINVQMNHWPTYSAGLGELNRPLIELVRRLVPSGEQTAKTFYGEQAQGWVMHMMTNVWNYTAPGEHPSWGATNTGGAWLCAHLWEEFLFTRDTAYLKEIYPIMKGAADFFHSTLIREPEHGWLVTAPTSSPENSFYLDDYPAPVSICMGPTMDIQIITELYRNVIAAAEILATDSDYCEMLEADLNDFPPMQISPEGYLQEWLEDYREAEPHHRHVSHLYGLYPGHLITASATPELIKAARKTLERRGDDGTGWSRAWKINFWARLQDGERAWKLFSSLLEPAIDTASIYHHSGTYPNLFCAHPPFQIDGNFGGTAGIAEMLVQSHEGFIRFLPAIPASWSEGSVKGFIARPGARLDFEWENAQMKSATLTALHTQDYAVKCPDNCLRIETIYRGKEYISDENGLLQIDLNKGDQIEIQFLTGF